MRLRLSLALLGLLLVTAADSSPSCMTKREARAHYPRAHIFWHTERRCWDDRRGGSRYRKQHRDPLFTRVQVAGPVMVRTVPIVYRPLTLAPGSDVYLRFLPWEQRVAGSFP